MTSILSEPGSRVDGLDLGMPLTDQERGGCLSRRRSSFGNMNDVLPAYRTSVATQASVNDSHNAGEISQPQSVNALLQIVSWPRT